MPVPLERLDQVLHAAGAERVGRMHDRPFPLAERVDAVIGDHARRIDVVRPDSGTATDCPCGSVAGRCRRSSPACRASAMSGAMAWTWVERIEPRNAGISGVAGELAEREHDARVGRLVVLDERVRSGRPSTPPALLISSTASFAPWVWNRPDSAPGPVSGATMPILSVSAGNAGAATSRMTAASQRNALAQARFRIVSSGEFSN